MISSSVTAVIDSAGGLQRASAANPDTRAWELEATPTSPGPHGSISWFRMILLVLQVLGFFAVIVMSLPREWGGSRA